MKKISGNYSHFFSNEIQEDHSLDYENGDWSR